MPDEDHLAYATSQRSVIYSYNVGDYCDLHAQWLSVGEQMRRILRLRAAASAIEGAIAWNS
jgi:hypothetical protein